MIDDDRLENCLDWVINEIKSIDCIYEFSIVTACGSLICSTVQFDMASGKNDLSHNYYVFTVYGLGPLR